MKNILLLGGTRFVGKNVLRLLQEQSDYKIFVASRREISAENFIKFDRKNLEDLIKIFSTYDFDVVVDFINFSASDTEKLLSALNKCEKKPHLVSISTIYAYSSPENLEESRVYYEKDFDPLSMELDFEMTSGWDYTKGKQSMEAYLKRYYASTKSTVLRFPIILGEDDYTGRTYFYTELINKNKQIGLSGKGKRSNYIFSLEAAQAIFFFIKTLQGGTFNVALNDSLNEREILELYCDFYGKNIEEVWNKSLELTKSPFFYKNDFLVDTSKFEILYKFTISFKEALFRELKKMKK